ncbi:hypothetical protein [Nonomuraea angiospora]|uniref:hypothetical protein n=1 Tax=Nonomuraea angiospora TaxID=46172 RepID=UPI0029A80BB6|nr:hypothetical protein [Nonomuraea angiospora]MDX3109692.1 hypothetical protein [Nonomuraea angiospora]
MTRIDITTRDLHQLIAPVLPHASTDASIPELNVVRFETSGMTVHAVATDRATMAATRRPVGFIDDCVIHIDRTDCIAMLKLFTFTKEEDPDLTLILDQVTVPVGNTSLSALALRIDSQDGTRLVLHDRRVPGQPTALDGWRKVIGKVLHREQTVGAPALLLAPAMLPRWSKAAAGKGERLTVFCGPDPSDSILVAVEQHFIGVWVPAGHLDAGGDLLDGNPWRDELPAPASAAEPT